MLSASPHSWLCSFTVDVCNNCVFDWKTSDRRAAVHLKTLSTFLLGLTRSFTFFYLSFHNDGISSAGHMCSTNIRQKQLFFSLVKTELNVLPVICLIYYLSIIAKTPQGVKIETPPWRVVSSNMYTDHIPAIRY